MPRLFWRLRSRSEREGIFDDSTERLECAELVFEDFAAKHWDLLGDFSSLKKVTIRRHIACKSCLRDCGSQSCGDVSDWVEVEDEDDED